MLRRLLIASFLLLGVSNSQAIPEPDLAIYGPTFGTDCGTSFATGDFNGDGFTDIAVLCVEYDYGLADLTFHILWGSNALLPTIIDLAAPLALRSILYLNDYPSGLGIEQLDVVDLNGDHHDDLVLTSPYNGLGTFKVIWGAPAFPDEANIDDGAVATTDFIWGLQGYQFGIATAAGDIDGDGFQDLLVSAPDANTVFIIHGAPTFPPVFTFPGSAGAMSFVHETVPGWSTGVDLDVDDIDKDGREDILIGSFGSATDDDDSNGKATLILGADLIRGGAFILQKHQSNTTRFLSQDPNDAIGFSVALADVDGDSFLDVVLGAKYTTYGEYLSCGAAHVIYDQWNWDDYVFIDSGETPVTSIWGYGYDDQYGMSVACDDVTGDIYAEVVLTSEARRVVSVLGAGNLPGSIELETYDPNRAYLSDQVGDYFGRDIGIDDITGDEIGDLLIAAKWYNGLGRNSSGAIFVYYGDRATAVGNEIHQTRVPAARVINSPNPFSGSTTITLTGVPSDWIDIFDVTGRRITSLPLAEGPNRASTTWNGTDAAGRSLASGMYFARPRGHAQFVGGRLLLIR